MYVIFKGSLNTSLSLSPFFILVTRQQYNLSSRIKVDKATRCYLADKVTARTVKIPPFNPQILFPMGLVLPKTTKREP